MGFVKECPQNPDVLSLTPAEQRVERNYPHKFSNRLFKFYRLHKKRDIRYLFGYGKAFKVGAITFVYLLSGNQPHAEMLIAVKKKYGNAPKRNLAKRRIRELFRLSLLKNQPGLMFSVIVSPSPIALTSHTIDSAFTKFSTHLKNELAS